MTLRRPTLAGLFWAVYLVVVAIPMLALAGWGVAILLTGMVLL